MQKLKKYAATKAGRDAIISFGIVIIAFIVMQALLAADMVSSLLEGLLVPICAYVVMAVSLNLTVGILGELSLGHAGFMSVGAFSGIVAATCLSGTGAPEPVQLAVSIVIGGICAAIAGVIIGVPVLRLKGDYLAIVTLAFGEIIKNIVNVLYVGLDSSGLHFSLLEQRFELAEDGEMIINGAMGVSGVSRLSTFVSGFVLVLITLLLVLNLINSRAGRAVMAVRDNKIAADSIGISTTRYKLMAFVISAAFAGMAGTLYGLNYTTTTANKFDFNTSILILVFVVLGGLGNIWGSVIAATLLTVLPEMLREVGDFRMLIYAILLIAMMLFNNSPLKQRILEKRGMKQMEKLEKRSSPGRRARDMAMLEVTSLGISFGGLRAVDELSMKIEKGGLVGLIGPNGAGKTTVFNMLTGVYRPTDGGIRLDGQNLIGKKPHEICRLGVARTFQNIRLFGGLTVLDNVKTGLHNEITYSLAESLFHLGGYRKKERQMDEKAMELLEVFGLGNVAGYQASNLPYGKQRKLEIARALATDPKLLLLDEPAAGMNPNETGELMETIELVRERFGVTVLLIEHDMKLVSGICEYLYVLNFGRLLAEGTPAEVLKNPEVVTAYLGE